MSIKSIEQEIAQFCFNEISSYKRKLKDKDELLKFKSDIRRLPAMITNNGLLATMAFYKKTNEDVYNTINNWFLNKLQNRDLIKYLINMDYEELLFKTYEVLKLADWLKRIVEVEIKDEKTTEG
ncbi:type III-B CRISPR module-associated protein Cmr5 [Anaerocellum diazotrophicum]|uniref:CRISPR type III-B/RAMP module-associated protein Cmr5 n=1 Tax=Caldicellulosiruptor diazotrophicus TaxID=2806205 RepID=A0ABN6E9T2_9FIRM|nr:type III-B CRISPR module-associated protein Cmr5 [Caldicellulosiruptor diazotrophicus]BCS82312.1 hypothetical protein CaldiYA01_22720 [Caldicellulosiruptor diazotrophicus]